MFVNDIAAVFIGRKRRQHHWSGTTSFLYRSFFSRQSASPYSSELLRAYYRGLFCSLQKSAGRPSVQYILFLVSVFANGSTVWSVSCWLFFYARCPSTLWSRRPSPDSGCNRLLCMWH